MSRIAVLSKSSLTDSQIDQKLKKLGFEVFFSLEMVDLLLHQKVEGKLFLSLFSTIIFTETVPDEDIKQIIQSQAAAHTRFFRCDTYLPSEEELAEWQELGLQNWLQADISLSELREKISESFTLVLRKNSGNFGQSLFVEEGALHLLEGSLSRKERELFEVLKEQRGEFITRNELSETIWHREGDNSTFSQLSQLTKKLKSKMKKSGINPDFLISNWKDGYALSASFLRRQCPSVTNANQ